MWSFTARSTLRRAQKQSEGVSRKLSTNTGTLLGAKTIWLTSSCFLSPWSAAAIFKNVRLVTIDYASEDNAAAYVGTFVCTISGFGSVLDKSDDLKSLLVQDEKGLYHFSEYQTIGSSLFWKCIQNNLLVK